MHFVHCLVMNMNINKFELILIEDDPLISLDAADSLSQAGFKVTLATNLKAAEKLLQHSRFDMGIADFELVQETSLPVVEKLYQEAVPLAIVSGSRIADIRMSVPQEVRVFQKPVNYVEVAGKLLKHKLSS